MIGVAKEGPAIFGGYPRCPQATRERVAKVVNANQWQAGFVPCPLPAVVVHLVDAPATIRNTQMGCFPRCDLMIDQATSLRITTCGRFVLKASAGMTKTLRPTSGTLTSHSYCKPHTLLSRSPVLMVKSAMRARCGGSRRNSAS